MGVIEMKEDPTGEANKQPNTPNLLNWRRSDKQKEAKSGNGQHKKTVQAATPEPVSLPALDRNKNAKKRHDKGTAKEEGKTKQHRRDENKKNQDTHKKKDTVEGGEQMSQSSASESTSESSCSTEGKKIQEGPVEDEYDDSDALDPPPSPGKQGFQSPGEIRGRVLLMELRLSGFAVERGRGGPEISGKGFVGKLTVW